MVCIRRSLLRNALAIGTLATGLTIFWSPAWAQGVNIPDPCAGGCGPVGGDGGGGGGDGGFGGGGESSVDNPEVGVDFSPDLFSDTLTSLAGLGPNPVPNRGDGSQEARLRNILKRFQNLPGGGVMPNRGGPGGDWDPATAPQWNPVFAIAWHIEPVLFTIPPGLNRAWAQFYQDKARRAGRPGGADGGPLTQFPDRDAATLELTNAAFDEMQAGNFAAAVEKFEEALRRNPDDAGIRAALEDARVRAGHQGNGQAFAALSAGGQTGPRDGPTTVLIAAPLSAQEMAAYSRTVALLGGDRAAAQAERPLTAGEAEALAPAFAALADGNYDKACPLPGIAQRRDLQLLLAVKIEQRRLQPRIIRIAFGGGANKDPRGRSRSRFRWSFTTNSMRLSPERSRGFACKERPPGSSDLRRRRLPAW